MRPGWREGRGEEGEERQKRDPLGGGSLDRFWLRERDLNPRPLGYERNPGSLRIPFEIRSLTKSLAIYLRVNECQKRPLESESRPASRAYSGTVHRPGRFVCSGTVWKNLLCSKNRRFPSRDGPFSHHTGQKNCRCFDIGRPFPLLGRWLWAALRWNLWLQITEWNRRFPLEMDPPNADHCCPGPVFSSSSGWPESPFF